MRFETIAVIAFAIVMGLTVGNMVKSGYEVLFDRAEAVMEVAQ